MRRLLALILTTAPAMAADEAGQFAIEGPGGFSCARILEVAEEGSPELGVILAWSLGYLTATNRQLPDTYDLTPWQRPDYVLSQVLGFCRDNPEVSYEAGLQALVDYLRPDRMVEREEVVTFAGDELYASVLERARERLAAQGHDPGTPGDDDALAMAVREFQRLEALPESGRLDKQTLARLFR